MEKRLLTVVELAEQIGFKPGTIYNWTSAKRLPFIKIGGRVKFDVRDIDRILERLKVEPQKDTAI